MRTTTLEHTKLIFRENGILQIDYIKDYRFTVLEGKEVFVAARQMLADVSKCPVLITGGLHSSNDEDFRNYNASEEVMQYCSAVAMVISSLAQAIIANFFIKFHKPTVPTRFFTSEEKAVEWLKNFETVFEKKSETDKRTETTMAF